MRRALLVVVAVWTGSPKIACSQPSWGQGSQKKVTAPMTFRSTHEPAARYNEAVQFPPNSRLNAAIIAMVKEEAAKLDIRAPVADTRLFQACDDIAGVVLDIGYVNNKAVEFALQRYGIIDLTPHLIVESSKGDITEAIAENLRAKADDMLRAAAVSRFGIGTAKRGADGTHAIVFAMQPSNLMTAPFPRSVGAGGTLSVDARIGAMFRDPEVLVTRDDGQTDRLPVHTGKGGTFGFAVSCGSRTGRQQVEVEAIGPLGSTVLANFPVWCGQKPPPTMTIAPKQDEPVTTSGEAEKRLFELLNRDRAAMGLPALQWDDAVAAVARSHSEDMHRTKLVGHISPTTGVAADRVRAANIKGTDVQENVALAHSIVGAHDGLMNSPGHRANILSELATHVGIGVVVSNGASGVAELLVTQVFIRED